MTGAELQQLEARHYRPHQVAEALTQVAVTEGAGVYETRQLAQRFDLPLATFAYTLRQGGAEVQALMGGAHAVAFQSAIALGPLLRPSYVRIAYLGEAAHATA